MNYKDYNDFELLSYVCDNNEEAIEVLFEKYKPLIVVTANRLYCYCKNTGLEINDLIQEGMLGLNFAINSFSDDKDTMFYTYARTCIERKMISMIVGARRLKHRVLNESLSIESTDDFNETFVHEKSLEDNSYNPENVLLSTEHEEELIEEMNKELTDLEVQVFELKRNGFEYKEIAEILDKDVKSIDNALQRIRIKLRKFINSNEENI